MSIKTIGLYGGFFAGMFVVALFVTGVFQQGILPRFSGHGKDEPKKHQAETGAKGVPEHPPTPAAGAPTAEPKSAPEPSGASAVPGVAHAAVPPVEGAKEVASDAGAPVKRLSKMYEGMRPKEAAGVLEKLGRPFAAQVLAEINPRQAAKILAAMNPTAAAELTRLLGQPGGKPTT
jgi:hypothetical protein